MAGSLDQAFGYQGDHMNLPVADVETAVPFYERVDHGDAKWRVFYVVAPDGLCYWFGERQAP